MTSHAPKPTRDPDGMIHVGWRCTHPDHTCLRALSDVNPDLEVERARWNHNATWAPVFARVDDL